MERELSIYMRGVCVAARPHGRETERARESSRCGGLLLARVTVR
jgi:hypothetical protein